MDAAKSDCDTSASIRQSATSSNHGQGTPSASSNGTELHQQQGSRSRSDNSVQQWTLLVLPATGGRIELRLPRHASVADLKSTLTRRLRVPADRIRLLHRDRQLTGGRLMDDNGLADGSHVTLLPHVEAGLTSSTPPSGQSLLRAVDNLSDTQVNDFLTGNAPLTLAMRLGDHVIFMQLQLSTTTTPTTTSPTQCTPPSIAPTSRQQHPHHRHHHHRHCSTTAAGHLPDDVENILGPASLSLDDVFTPGRCEQQQHLHHRCSLSTASSSPSSSPSPPSSPASYPSPCSTPGSSCSSSSGDETTSPEVSRDAATSLPLPFLNHTAVSQARRCLTDKLRKLSNVAQSRYSDTQSATSNEWQSDAVIDSMQHMGHGVFSGTFSGTLNPSLQGRDGKPKRDVSTIVHILNDLLGASSFPQSQGHQSQQPRVKTQTPAEVNHVTSIKMPCDVSATSTRTRDKMASLRAMLAERRQRRVAMTTTTSTHRTNISVPTALTLTSTGSKRAATEAVIAADCIPAEKKAKCTYF